MPTRTLQILNILGYIGVLVLNTLANALPINGKDTGELSEQYPNLFVPAGFTFSIWGLIYLLLGVFIFLQARSLWQSNCETPSYVRVIGPWFFVSSLANMLWILVWHYEFVVLSLFVMLGILGSLLIIYRRLRVGRSSVFPRGVTLPFSVYLGWISIATIANATAVLVHFGWNGGAVSEPVWAAVMILVGAILGILFLYKYADAAYAGVLIWAFFGIFAKRNTVEPIQELVVNTALGAIGLLIVMMLIALTSQKKPSLL